MVCGLGQLNRTFQGIIVNTTFEPISNAWKVFLMLLGSSADKIRGLMPINEKDYIHTVDTLDGGSGVRA